MVTRSDWFGVAAPSSLETDIAALVRLHGLETMVHPWPTWQGGSLVGLWASFRLYPQQQQQYHQLLLQPLWYE